MTAIFIFVLFVLAGHEVLMSARIERKYPPRGDFVDVETARLHYVSRRNAPAGPVPSGPVPSDHGGGAKSENATSRTSGPAPVVLIHGSSGSSADMSLAFFEAFPPEIELYAFDRPGLGWSRNKISPVEMSDPMRQAAAIHEAVEKLGLEKPVVVGHSWGAAVAAAYALRFGEEISGAVSLSGVVYPWQGPHGWYDLIFTTPVLNHVFARLFLNKIGRLYIPSSIEAIFAPEEVREDYREAAQAEIILRPSAIIHNSHYAYHLRGHLEKMSGSYGRIRTPMLIAAGDADEVVNTVRQSERLHGEVPGSEYVRFNGAGHMPHHTQTPVLARKITQMARGIPLEAGKKQVIPASGGF